MNEEILGQGCQESKKDKRTVKHEDLAYMGEPYLKGGIDYMPKDILHQHRVGICTAISLVQLKQKQTGKKYSPEFQYLAQKKMYDGNWTEGSSIFSALKVAKNIGFLPADKWIYSDESDRYLPYIDYINKLKINDSQFERLKTLCIDKIAGYARVEPNDPVAISKAIEESSAGLLCRYDCGSTWWLPSWLPKDINPLRKPSPATSGHAVIMNKYNYEELLKQKIANTWGIKWCLQGCADIIHNMYSPTEVWTILKENPMFKFTKTLRFGMKDNEVKQLQLRLLVFPQSGWFGPLTLRAVRKYQANKGLKSDGIVGILTRQSLNL